MTTSGASGENSRSTASRMSDGKRASTSSIAGSTVASARARSRSSSPRFMGAPACWASGFRVERVGQGGGAERDWKTIQVTVWTRVLPRDRNTVAQINYRTRVEIYARRSSRSTREFPRHSRASINFLPRAGFSRRLARACQLNSTRRRCSDLSEREPKLAPQISRCSEIRLQSRATAFRISHY